MGCTFHNFHISLKDLSSDEIMSSIDEYMKKNGYVNSKADENVEVSFKICKSDKWFSYVVPGDGADSEIGDELYKNICSDGIIGLSVECVDSDFAMLQLHSQNHEKASVVIGAPYDEGMIEASNLDEWKELISEREHFLKIINEDYTFVEDGLDDIGDLLGMDDGQILLSEDSEDDDGECIQLDYRIKKQGKNKSFKTLFKEIFGEGLRDEGFVVVKGRYPYLARMVGEDVYQIITYLDTWCVESCYPETRGYKALKIVGTFASTYRKNLIFDSPPSEEKDFLYELRIYQFHSGSIDSLMKPEFVYYLYNPNDPKSMMQSINNALAATKGEIIGKFSWVNDLKSCLKFNESFHNQSQIAPICDDAGNIVDRSEEGCLYLVCNELGDMYHYLENYIEEYRKAQEMKGLSAELKMPEIFRTGMKNKINAKELLFTDDESRNDILDQLETRKMENRRRLEKLGIWRAENEKK